jgi:hypothetical protein
MKKPNRKFHRLDSCCGYVAMKSLLLALAFVLFGDRSLILAHDCLSEVPHNAWWHSEHPVVVLWSQAGRMKESGEPGILWTVMSFLLLFLFSSNWLHSVTFRCHQEPRWYLLLYTLHLAHPLSLYSKHGPRVASKTFAHTLHPSLLATPPHLPWRGPHSLLPVSNMGCCSPVPVPFACM